MQLAEVYMHPWKTFVVLGDSFTEGIGDSVDGRGPVSTLDQLATVLKRRVPDMRYINLARRGLLTREVRETQLEPALALKPDLVSIIAGANDLLKRKWQPGRYEEDMWFMFRAFKNGGATLMSATHPDWTVRLPLPEPAKAKLQAQIVEANTILRRLAKMFDAAVVETYQLELDHDPTLWSRDGIHPNTLGYDAYAEAGRRTLEAHSGLALERQVE